MIAIHLFISWFSEEKLDPLDDRGRTHASADAQRHQCGREIASLQFINDGAEDHGAGRAERVTHGDRPAVDIDPGRIEVESLAIAQHYRRKCLVDFDEIDVVERHLAFAKTFSVTSTGPVSMIAGSEPILANALMRIRGFNPAFSPACLLPISTAAAPSTMPDELPAWCTRLIVSSSGCACTATASKPPISPSCTKEGLSCAKDCSVVVGRMCSSLARMVSPFTSLTEITECAKRPSFHAVAARFWLSTA